MMKKVPINVYPDSGIVLVFENVRQTVIEWQPYLNLSSMVGLMPFY